MLELIKKVLAPPFYEDENKNRAARFLHIILLTSSFAALAGVGVDYISGNPRSVTPVLFGVVLLSISFALNQRGFVLYASYFFIIVISAVITVIIALGQGIHDITITTYPLVLIISSYLLDRKGNIFSIVIVVVSLSVVVLGRNLGLLPIDDMGGTGSLYDLVIVSLILIISAVAMNYLSWTIFGAIESAQKSARENKLINLQLRKQTELLKISEARWRGLVDNVPDVIMLITRDGGIAQTNQTETGLGDQYMGKSIFDLLLEKDHASVKELIDTVFETGKPAKWEGLAYTRHREKSWYSVRIGAVKDQNNQVTNATLLITNIKDRIEAEQALAKSEAEARRRAEQLTVLNEIGKTVTALHDLNGTLDIILEQVKSAIQLDAFIVAFYDKNNNTVTFPLMYDSGSRWIESAYPLSDETWTAKCIKSRQPLLINRTIEEVEKDKADKAHNALGDSSKISASIMLAPMMIGNRVLGTIAAHNYTLNAYNEEDLTMLTGAAHQIAIAVENARLFDALQNELRERQRAEEALRLFNNELEERVRQRTHEFEIANRELEAFSYTVSHDLRAPLRSIHGFSKILNQDFAEHLPNEAKKYLTRIYQSASQMGQLIDDLLSLSRIGRQTSLRADSVDMETLVRSVCKELQEQSDISAINFNIHPMPNASGDASLIKQVYVNLISNAVKFTRPHDKAKIEIGFISKDGKIVYYVKDNGVGFSMQHAEKLFGVFQRLHHHDEFEGTGVGLAIVQRILNKHGGYAWAESKINEGATFYFILG